MIYHNTPPTVILDPRQIRFENNDMPQHPKMIYNWVHDFPIILIFISFLLIRSFENCFFDNEYFLLTQVSDVNAPSGS